MNYINIKSQINNISIKSLLKNHEYNSYGSTILSDNRPSIKKKSHVTVKNGEISVTHEDGRPPTLAEWFPLSIPAVLNALETYDENDIKLFLRCVVNVFSLRIYDPSKSLEDFLLNIHCKLLSAEISAISHMSSKLIEDDDTNYHQCFSDSDFDNIIACFKEERELVIGMLRSYPSFNPDMPKKARKIFKKLLSLQTDSNSNEDLLNQLKELAENISTHSDIAFDDNFLFVPENIIDLCLFRNVAVLNYICEHKTITDELIFSLSGCLYISAFKQFKKIKGNFEFINYFHHLLTINVLKLLDKLDYQYIPAGLQGIICRTKKKNANLIKTNNSYGCADDLHGILYLSKTSPSTPQYKCDVPISLTNNFIAFTYGFLSARCIRFYEKYNMKNINITSKKKLDDINNFKYTEFANHCKYLNGGLCTELRWNCPFIKESRLWHPQISRLNSRQIKFLFNYDGSHRDIERLITGELKTYPIKLLEAIEKSIGLPIFLFDNSPKYSSTTPLHAKSRYHIVNNSNWGIIKVPSDLRGWNAKPIYVDKECFNKIKEKILEIDEFELKDKIRNYYKNLVKLNSDSCKDSIAAENKFVLGIKNGKYDFCFIRVFLDLCKILELDQQEFGYKEWQDPTFTVTKGVF